MSTGTIIIEKAAQKLGQRYVFGQQVPLNNHAWNGPWDCAEYCSWSVFQASGIMYGTMNNNYTVYNSGNPATADAYTGFWDHDSRTQGTRISVAEAARIPGAMVLRAPTSSRTGHIAISDGNGGTLEAKGTAWGVVRDRIAGRTWDIGVLVPGIHYQEAVEQASPDEPYVAPADIIRLTSPYFTSSEVGLIQRRLIAFEYAPGPIDNIYGPKTQAAVIAFQIDQGITIDGEVGPETRGALFPEGIEEAADQEAEGEELDGAWTCSENWRTTGYYTPIEANYPPVDMRKISVEGSNERFPDRFVKAVRMEGWGKTRTGWYLGYYSGRYHRESEPKDSHGRKLEEGAVAVDPRLISRGTKIKINGVPPVSGRIFVAKDVGGAIDDRHIDIYCGEGDGARLMTYSVTKDGADVCTMTS